MAEQLAGYVKAQAPRELCFDLDIEFENLGDLNHRENARNPVSVIESRGELDVLPAYFNEKWPSIRWLDGV